MKTLMKLALCFMLLVLSSPAMAGINYQMILPGTGPTTSFGDVNFYSVSGDAQTLQNLGPDHVLNAGDTFTQTNVKLLYVSDTLNGVTENIALGGQANKLYVSAPFLTGFITTPGGVPYFNYDPNQAAFLYWDHGINHDLLANINLTSGIGLVDDGVSGPINNTPTGTVHLDGTFLNILPGVFFSGGVDLSTLTNGSVVAQLRGVNNVTSNTPILDQNEQPIALQLIVHDNADQTLATPEPASMTLMGLGALGAAFMRRRAARKA